VSSTYLSHCKTYWALRAYAAPQHAVAPAFASLVSGVARHLSAVQTGRLPFSLFGRVLAAEDLLKSISSASPSPPPHPVSRLFLSRLSSWRNAAAFLAENVGHFTTLARLGRLAKEAGLGAAGMALFGGACLERHVSASALCGDEQASGGRT